MKRKTWFVVAAIVVALGGLTFAWVTYQKGRVDPDRIAASWPP
jgi:hypothetical protein